MARQTPRVVLIKYRVNGMDDVARLSQVRRYESFTDTTTGKSYWRKTVTAGDPLSDFVPETSDTITSDITVDGGKF